ncbi:predicted protein [Botrytis cinerea T4]|uniref:Uncharacterized protein n=1 Tax=Botryotinia fuckeliana (strain T4) TaxID=999810 RepID=G2YSM4_BOTF4|nr:predicted protein [Botrytis cinerea T4]
MTQTPYNKEELTYRTRSVDPYRFYGERCRTQTPPYIASQVLFSRFHLFPSSSPRSNLTNDT